MHKTFAFLTAFCTWLVFADQAIAKPQKPSEDMILILIHHKSGPNDLDPKELSLDKTKSLPSKSEMTEYEAYVVPYPEGVADIFEFRVFLHAPSGRYWIHKMGGVGGANEFYGPGEVKSLRK